MSIRFTLSYLPLIFAILISGFLAMYTWRRRQVPGAVPFSLMMLALFEWGLFYVFQLAAPDLQSKILLSKITFIGIVATPTSWLLFAIGYSGNQSWITRRRLVMLSIMPILTLAALFTNESHQLFWPTQELDVAGPFLVLNSSNGFLFWIHATYSYILLLIGTILAVRIVLRWPRQYRGQGTAVLFAVATPWLANAITIFEILPIPIDLTPFAFTVTGLGMAYALFRHHLLDLRPIARDVIIDSTQDGMIVIDTSDRIVDINQAAKRILNIPKEQPTLGRALEEVLANFQHLLQRYQNVLEAEDEITIGEGDAQRWYELNLSALRDEQDQLLGQLIVARDITERKRAAALLEDSERRFRTLVESASDCIYRTDANGYFTYANPSALHIMGFSSEQEVLGKHFLELTAPEARNKVKETYQEQFRAKTPNTYYEFPALTKDGRELWFGQNAQLLMEGDRVTGFQVVARDITAIKQAQEALKLAHDKALEASQAKSQLLAKVSHELRTPLGGILGYAELLHNRTFGKLTDEQQNAVTEIMQSANYLTTMVNELIDESQIQANKTILKETIFSPAQLLQQATSGMEISALKKGLGFMVYLAPTLPQELFGDERRLRQILINLIGNAIKFTNRGEVRVSFLHPGADHWIMQVKDTGMGISDKAQTSIFEPFHQADDAITFENRGIGLGLSITKQLVELMGGQITLESQVGMGSTFTIKLPIVRPTDLKTRKKKVKNKITHG